jgi:hypothetical protein
MVNKEAGAGSGGVLLGSTLPGVLAEPQVTAKPKEPSTKDRKFEDVVQSAQKAAVLVLVY